jgi:hypothetical protein
MKEELVLAVDSGNRTEFGTGGQRDMGSKGRCDLLPWDIVSTIFLEGTPEEKFCLLMYDATHRVNLKETVADLLVIAAEVAFDSLETAMLEAAFQYEAGAIKYDDPRNWELGLPLDIYLDSSGRHFLKYSRHDADERHDRSMIWNLLGANWTIKNRPEMINVDITKNAKKVK